MSADATLEQLAQVSAPVLAALRQLWAFVDAIGDGDVKAQHVSALRTIDGAIQRWADGLAKEVVAGTRTLERWRTWGAELSNQVTIFARDVGDSSVQFSRLANVVGNAAQAVVDARDKVFAKVTKLQADMKVLAGKRKLLEDRRKLLANKPISAETRELLFGPTSQNALKDYERLRKLVEGLTAVVNTIRTGKAQLTADGSGDLKAVPTTQLGAVTLGSLTAIVGSMGVLGTIAVAVSIAASLMAFFGHLDERLNVDLKRTELELIKAGRGAEVAALKKAQTEADKEKPSGFGDQVATAVKALLGLGAVGGAVYVGKKIYDESRRAA